MELDNFKDFTRVLANESGKIVRKYFRSDIHVERKKDSSPVTIADKTAEEKMRELIMKEFPDHGILGEEFGEHNPKAEYQWILDPIDGTKSFITGTVMFGTLIALLKNNSPVLGVINQPVMNDFLIGDNVSAQLNGMAVHVNDTSKLAEASLMTTDQINFEQYQDIDKFLALTRSVRLYRMWGDCYGYFLVATGFADIMIDPVMHIWDTAALIPVIRGAGGVITDYQGNDPLSGNAIIASNKKLHPLVVSALNKG